MTDRPQQEPRPDAAAIRREWLEQARQTHVVDTFASKRQKPRFAWRAQLDVRVPLGGGQIDIRMVSARDISESGLMLFCREKIAPSTNMDVSLAGGTDSVPAVIRHCTQTLGGYLIGADFR